MLCIGSGSQINAIFEKNNETFSKSTFEGLNNCLVIKKIPQIQKYNNLEEMKGKFGQLYNSKERFF